MDNLERAMLKTKQRKSMKTYNDLPDDGGSDIAGQVTRQIGRLEERLNSVHHTVAIMSGKGGVGKSSITANLASALAIRGNECWGARRRHQRAVNRQNDRRARRES